MKLSKIFAATAAAFVMGSAVAAPIPYTGGVEEFTLTPNAVVEFSFNLPGLSDLFMGSMVVNANHSLELFKGATLIAPTTSFTMSSSFGSNMVFSYDNLGAGDYLAKVTNLNNKVAFGSFQANVTPVPEAESIALALAGLGVVGAVAARRRKQ